MVNLTIVINDRNLKRNIQVLPVYFIRECAFQGGGEVATASIELMTAIDRYSFTTSMYQFRVTFVFRVAAGCRWINDLTGAPRHLMDVFALTRY